MLLIQIDSRSSERTYYTPLTASLMGGEPTCNDRGLSPSPSPRWAVSRGRRRWPRGAARAGGAPGGQKPLAAGCPPRPARPPAPSAGAGEGVARHGLPTAGRAGRPAVGPYIYFSCREGGGGFLLHVGYMLTVARLRLRQTPRWKTLCVMSFHQEMFIRHFYAVLYVNISPKRTHSQSRVVPRTGLDKTIHFYLGINICINLM